MATHSEENGVSDSRLFVSGLYEDITEEAIRNHFEPFGSITDIYILRQKKNKRKSRGCCFIGFLDKYQASNAYKACNNSFIGTRRISVKFALNKPSVDDQSQRPSMRQDSTVSATNASSSKSTEKTEQDKHKKDKDYLQFVKLTKSTATNLSADQLLDTFLNDSDEDDDQSDIDVANPADNKDTDTVTGDRDDASNDDDDEDGEQTEQVVQNTEVTEIFVRNLPFMTRDENLYSFFAEFGNIRQVFIPVDDFGKVKGYAFVEFESNDCIQKLFGKYRNTLKRDQNGENPMISVIMNGRNVNVLLSNYKYREVYYINGKEICYDDLDDEMKSNLSFKQLRDLKLKHNAKNDVNWNTFFVPTDNILRYNAKQLNTTKKELLGINNMDERANANATNSMAVTTTLAETAVISKTKAFLAENGIDIEVFNQSKARTVRSRNIILVKNFPYNTTANELRRVFEKFGQIEKLLVPETKSCAIVQFLNVKEAQNAFHSLAYSKFKHLPLFLEWAPINLFRPETLKTTAGKTEQNEENEIQERTEDEVKLKRGRKRKLAEIDNDNDDDDALDRKEEKIEGDESKTKVIVKNIPFETTKKEIEKLFNIYGQIKSLRLPRKYGGGHRGFCFIEFDTHKEAVNAMSALSASHFYGRHLVIQWANQGTQSHAQKTNIE